MFENLPDVLDANTLAKALHISRSSSYNLLSSRDFPVLKIGGRKMVLKECLIDWLRDHTTDVKSETRRKGR